MKNKYPSDSEVDAAANNTDAPVFTTRYELFQLRIILPSYYKGPGLYEGDTIPKGSQYLTIDTGIYIPIPNNAIFMGSQTIINPSAVPYSISVDGIPTLIGPGNSVVMPSIGYKVPSGMYTESLIINDTQICKYVVADLEQDVICVMNKTTSTIIAVNNGKTHLIAGLLNFYFTSGTVGVILPPNTENYFENGSQIIEPIGATAFDNTSYIQVIHMSNTAEGVIDDIQASNNTISNNTLLAIEVPMEQTETNSIYNQSNAPVKITSGGNVYTLQINQVQQFNSDALITLDPNIQPTVFDASGNNISKLSGTQAVNNYYRVVVQTIDMSLRPAHIIKPPELDAASKDVTKPPSSELVGVDMSAISPHVSCLHRIFSVATHALCFVVNGVVDGLETTVETAPKIIYDIPADIVELPKAISKLPSDAVSAGKLVYAVNSRVDPIPLVNDLIKSSKKSKSEEQKGTTDN